MGKQKFDKRPRWIRHRRIRRRVKGQAERPRLAVFRSVKQIYAQIIDDERGHTLVAASSLEPELRADCKTAGRVGGAVIVGETVAKRAMTAGISKVVLDRGGYRYHGRVKALADAARSEGLDF